MLEEKQSTLSSNGDHMKHLLISTLALFASALAFARPLHSINCVTEFPTASYVGTSDEQKKSLEVLFINHGGPQLVPIHSGIVTNYDLSYLKNKASLLEKLPTEFRFLFDIKNCTLNQDGSFSCFKPYNSKDIVNEETSLVPTRLRSMIITTQLDDMTYREIEISMNLSDGVNQYSINTKYPEAECETNTLTTSNKLFKR